MNTNDPWTRSATPAMLSGVRRGLLIAGFAMGMLWLQDSTLEGMAAVHAQADSKASRTAARNRACPGIGMLDTSSASSCTLAGCLDQCVVTVTVPSALPEGQYRFVIELDDHRIPCRVTRYPDSRGAVVFECDESVRVMPWRSAQVGAPERYHLEFDRLPNHVSMTLYRGKTRIADGRTDVTYRANLPNGVGCSPACCQGSGSVVLTFGH